MADLTTDEVKETYQMGGEGVDFKRVFYKRGQDFDAWVESIRAEEREKAADLADRWLSNAQNFPWSFVEGSFMIERNAAAHAVPAAIRSGGAPPHEPGRRNET